MRPRLGYATPPEQEGGWSAARRCILFCTPCGARCPETAGHSPYGAPPRRFLGSGRAFREPFQALRQRAPRTGPYWPGAGSRAVPSACLRSTPAGATPRSTSRTPPEGAPVSGDKWIKFLDCGSNRAVHVSKTRRVTRTRASLTFLTRSGCLPPNRGFRTWPRP